MEFMKYILLACALLVMPTMLQAQTQAQLQEAFLKSYTAESSKKYGEAITSLEAVFFPSSYEMNLRLGWLYYLDGKLDRSVGYYKTAVTLMPAATEALWGIVTVYEAKKDWVNVEKSYVSILKLDPKNSAANYRMGVIYYYRKDYTTAKKYFDIALNLYPFQYETMLMSAWTNYFLGKTSEAKVLFYKVLLNHTNDASALEGLSLIK
jgi:tetratricopeptide (TPR) repeat protein